MERTGALVVGAGVIGLACARALARRGVEAIILEAQGAIGTEASSRNSEVIHSGIYYPKDSLKARLCVEGKQLLYEYCRRHHVGQRRCGKLIVATRSEEVDALDKLRRRGEANGLDDLRLLCAREAKALEPRLSVQGALHSPSSGIVDSHGLMLALLGEAQTNGAALALKSPLLCIEAVPSGFVVEVGGQESLRIGASFVINAAGLHAVRVARAIEGFPAQHVPRVYFEKGQYFSLSGKAPFSRLIYPLAKPGETAGHAIFDLGGQARLGPHLVPVEAIDYRPRPDVPRELYAAVRRYWRELPDGALQPAHCGVYPKLAGPGERPADFCIQSAAIHGLTGLVNLFGLESPGLTACLAIAERVCSELGL